MNKRRLNKAVKRISRLPLNKNLLLYTGNKVRHFMLRASDSTSVAWPSNIMLELSACCNLACTTCPREYEYGRAMDKGMMDVSLAKKIIDEAWPYLDSVGLTGMGETLLYNRLEEIVNSIKSKNSGIIISLSTNAQLPDFKERIAGLIDKVDTIQISIDGLDEVYESIRRKGSFRVFDENLKHIARLCRNSGTDLMLNMVVTKENYRHMTLLVNYAAENGIEYLDFTQFNLAAVTGVDRSYYEFYKTPEFMQEFAAMEEAVRQHTGIKVTTRSFSQGAGGFRNCSYPWGHFYISWDGYLVPCCAKPFPKELNFGNVREKSLIEILNSESFKSFRKLWFENKTSAFCGRCQVIYT